MMPTVEFPLWASDAAEIVSVIVTVGPVEAGIEVLGKKLQLIPVEASHEREMLPVAGYDPRKASCIVTAEEVEPKARGTAAGEGAPSVKSTMCRVKGVLRDKPAAAPWRLNV
jgi:hypothetical protein